MLTDGDALAGVLIPTAQRLLLLPNVCVAEVLPAQRLQTLDDLPAGRLGYLDWRGQQILVLQPADFLPDAAAAAPPARVMVVMNRVHPGPGGEFYALAASGLPRMVQLAVEDLNRRDDACTSIDAMHVTVGTEAATIPDLAFLEAQLSVLADA